MEDLSVNEFKTRSLAAYQSVAIARAIINRAKEAGIPEHMMRINENEFCNLLCDDFHPNKSTFAKNVYARVDLLHKKSFIIIDGGDVISRKKAGFAILFRMLSHMKTAKYEVFKTLAHAISTFKDTDGVSRNDYIAMLANIDTLYLSEFDKKDINTKLETGSFIDELLEIRDNNKRTTIITCTKPLLSRYGLNTQNTIDTDDFGNYMVLLSRLDIEPKERDFSLRIRVKSSGGK